MPRHGLASEGHGRLVGKAEGSPVREAAASRNHWIDAGQQTARKEPHTGTALGNYAAQTVLRAMGPGHPLPRSIASWLARRVDVDVAPVMVHDGPAADGVARAFQARALALGPHLAFRRGAYDVTSEPAIGLLAHELTHVGEQARTFPRVQRQPEPVAGTTPPPATAPFVIDEWAGVTRNLDPVIAVDLATAQIRDNKKLRTWFDTELGKRGQTAANLFDGTIRVPLVIMARGSSLGSPGQTRWDSVSRGKWSGWRAKGDTSKTLQPNQSIAIADFRFQSSMFATDKTDYNDAATLMIHELGHWVDAYADGKLTPPPAGSYDYGDYLETLVDDAVYEKAWSGRTAKKP